MYPDLRQVYGLILGLAVEIRIDIIDKLMLNSFARFVKSHDQRGQQYQVGEHRKDQGCRGKYSKSHRAAKIREGKNDKPCKEHDGGVDYALSCLKNTFTHRSCDEKVTCQKFL